MKVTMVGILVLKLILKCFMYFTLERILQNVSLGFILFCVFLSLYTLFRFFFFSQWGEEEECRLFLCLVGTVEFLGREFPNSITVSTKQTKK